MTTVPKLTAAFYHIFHHQFLWSVDHLENTWCNSLENDLVDLPPTRDVFGPQTIMLTLLLHAPTFSAHRR